MQCRLCSSKDTAFVFQLERYGRLWRIYECDRCTVQFVYLEPGAFDPVEFYQDFYDRPGRKNKLSATFVPSLYWSKQSRIIQKLVETSADEIKRICDVGCGPGNFLMHMPQSWEKHGIEMDDDAIAVAKNRGIMIGGRTIEEAKHPDNFFDVVTMYAVIEHMVDPRSAISEIRRILKPGGLLVVMTGDTRSMKARIKGIHWHMYSPPEHLFFFSSVSLDYIMELFGFNPIRRYFTDGGMTRLGINRYVNAILRRLVRAVNEWPIFNTYPIFDHNYSYYRCGTCSKLFEKRLKIR